MRLAGSLQALKPAAHQSFASGRPRTRRWASSRCCVCCRRRMGRTCSSACTQTSTSTQAGRRTFCSNWTNSSTPPSRRPGLPVGSPIQDGARVTGGEPPCPRHPPSSVRAGTQPGQVVPLRAPQDESLGQPCNPRRRQTADTARSNARSIQRHPDHLKSFAQNSPLPLRFKQLAC